MRELENLVSVLKEYIDYYSSPCSADESYLHGLRDGKLHAYLNVLTSVQKIVKEISHVH